MKIDWLVLVTIAGPIIGGLIGAWAASVFQRKPKLISYLMHASAFIMKDDARTTFCTHSIVVRNTGEKTATNVRIGHNMLPEHFNIFPSMPYTVEALPEGGTDIVLPSSVHGEQVTISYLYYPPYAWEKIVGMTKYDEGLAKIIRVLPSPQHPRMGKLLTFCHGCYWVHCYIVYRVLICYWNGEGNLILSLFLVGCGTIVRRWHTGR